MSETNHYFDPTAPLHPYTHSLPATPGTLPPPNALRSDAESLAAPAGFWPCEQNGAWVTVEDHRGKHGWIDGEPITITRVGPLPVGWSDAAPEPAYTLAEARAIKKAEIVAGANAVKAALSAQFSELEEKNWPQQEAGARYMLGRPETIKDPLAALFLADAESLAKAVAWVEELAAADRVAPLEFAARIAANADAADAAGRQAMLEQRALERAVNAARTVKGVLGIEVRSSVLG